MKKPFVIGIAGGSASGKSTFSDKLETALTDLSVLVFHMDHYFKPPEHRPFVKSPVKNVFYMDDNHPQTLDLLKLRQDLHSAIEKMEAEIIIIEGLLVLADEDIYNVLDFKLFVECRPDERIVRRLKRNMEWGLNFDEISNVYLDMVRFRHDEYVEPSKWKADLILNGSVFSQTAFDVVVNSIRNNLYNHS